jgi:hypothetical protein
VWQRHLPGERCALPTRHTGAPRPQAPGSCIDPDVAYAFLERFIGGWVGGRAGGWVGGRADGPAGGWVGDT